MEDIPAIMQFIRENWKENHILARDEKFFHWMYTDEEGCNVVLAEDEHNDICGMIGVIKYNSGYCWHDVESVTYEKSSVGIGYWKKDV